jgi:glucokinase
MTDAYSIGVDLGGTNLRIAAYAGATAFLETVTLPTRLQAGRDEVVRDLCQAVTALLSRPVASRATCSRSPLAR